MPHYPTSYLPFWAFRSILWPPTSWTMEARTFPSEQRWSQQQEHEGCSWETNCLLCSRMDSPPTSQSVTFTHSHRHKTTHLCTVKSCQTTGGSLNTSLKIQISHILWREGVCVLGCNKAPKRILPFDLGHKILQYAVAESMPFTFFFNIHTYIYSIYESTLFAYAPGHHRKKTHTHGVSCYFLLHFCTGSGCRW